MKSQRLAATFKTRSCLLQRYLQHKQVTADGCCQNQAAFDAALAFCANTSVVADYLPLAAMASTNAQTCSEYAAQFELLFQLLEASLSFDCDRKRFGAFSAEKAIAWWQQQQGQKKTTDLLLLHLGIENLGIREKFLQGKLHSQEKLLDIDLQRAIVSTGLNDRVSVLPLEGDSLGMALHLLRQKHSADLMPYTLPFLLQVSGNHWIYAIITVCQKSKKIVLESHDSLLINEAKKQQRQRQFQEALNYRVGAYFAYPDFDISYKIAGTGTQQDGWSCGYHAFFDLLKKLDDTGSLIRSHNQQLATIPGVGSDTASRRDAFYHFMLSDLNTSQVALNHDQVTVLQTPDNLIVYIKNLRHIPLQAARASVTFSQFQEYTKLAEETLRQKESLQEELFNTNEVTCDFAVLFSDQIAGNASLYRARARALAQLIDQHQKTALDNYQVDNSDSSLCISEQYKKAARNVLSLQNWPKNNFDNSILLQEFDRMAYFIDFRLEGQFDQRFLEDLSIIQGRNQLIREQNLVDDIDTASHEQSIWQQLWLHLWRDMSSSQIGIYRYNRELALNRFISFSDAFRKRALAEFFEFLASLEPLFRDQLSEFPYQKLHLGYGSNLESAFDSMELLKQHLENNAFFPFEKIGFHVSCTPNQNKMEALKAFLLAANGYNPFMEITLHVHNHEGSSFSEQQYQNLSDFFRKHKLCIRFFAHSEPGRETLENIIAINRRQLRIDQLTHAVDTKAVGELNHNRNADKLADANTLILDGSLEDSESGNVRPCKLNNFDARQALNTEVTFEQQQEQQTQARQESQTESEVESQAYKESDVENFSESDASQLINKEQYVRSQDRRINNRRPKHRDPEKNWEEKIAKITLNHSIKYIIPNVFEHLERFVSDGYILTGGFSFDNLPTGFYIQYYHHPTDSKKSGYVLCYDLTRKVENKNRSPLTVELNQSYSDNYPLGNLAQFNATGSFDSLCKSSLTIDAIIDLMKKSKPDLEQDDFFKKYSWYFFELDKHNMDFMLEKLREKFLSVASSSRISSFHIVNNASFCSSVFGNDCRRVYPGNISIYGCLTVNSLIDECSYWLDPDNIHMLPYLSFRINDGDKFSIYDLVIALPVKQSPFLLLDTLYHQGCEGIAALLDALKFLRDRDVNFCQAFCESFMSEKLYSLYSFKPLDAARSENIAVLYKLAELSDAEKNWWIILTREHKLRDSFKYLNVLYQAFQYFLSQWPQGIALPAECPIKNSPDMLVALDRLLFLLSKVRSQYLREQVEQLAELDWSSEGAWYAARHDGFHFFHQAMQLTPDRLDDSDLDNSNSSNAVSGFPTSSYAVRYEHLRDLAFCTTEPTNYYFNKRNQAFENAIPIFHRFIGRAERICGRYQCYIDLMDSLKIAQISDLNKLRLLPILALSTVGSRIKDDFDANPLFSVVGQLEIYEITSAQSQAKLDAVLEELLRSLDGNRFDTPLTLCEATGLIKLLHSNTSAGAELPHWIKIFLNQKTLAAVEVWNNNPQQCDKEKFLALYARMQDFDLENIKLLSRIVASIKQTSEPQDEQQFVSALENLKKHNPVVYLKAIDVLATIDIHAAMNTSAIPDFEAINTLLESLVNVDQQALIFPLIQQCLADCAFSFKTPDYSSLKPGEKFFDALRVINEFLNKAKLQLIDLEKLQQENGTQYFQDEYHRIVNRDIPDNLLNIFQALDINTSDLALQMQGQSLQQPSAIMLRLAYQAVKPLVLSFIEPMFVELLKSHYLLGIENIIAEDPALNLLGLQQCCFPAPDVFFKEEQIARVLNTLQAYQHQVSGLFSTLRDLRQRWRGDFSANFLIDSPRTVTLGAFNVDTILTAFSNADYHYAPRKILAAIFSKSTIDKQFDFAQLTGAICEIIQLKALGQCRKISLIEQLFKSESQARALATISQLQTIAQQHPAVLNDAFELLLNLDNPESMAKVLPLLQTDGQRTKLLFESWKNDSVRYSQTLILLEMVDADRKNALLTILAYAWPAKNYSEKQFTPEMVQQLNQLDYAALQKLIAAFNLVPPLGFDKLQQFLSLTDETSRERLLKEYELDPFGTRDDGDFESGDIHQKIDEIVDLVEGDDTTLPYTRRQHLYQTLAYVNLVGYTYPLSIPLAEAALKDYHKPVNQLNKAEIKTLFSHYCEVIRSESATLQQRKIAKLELVALARETYYRTNGEFAYPVQLLSVIDMVLQDDSAFYQIRTGEGKTLISALHAVLKWVKSGTVDFNCSSESLGERDQLGSKAFCDYFGIASAYVSSRVPYEQYQQQGINCGDGLEMQLFKEKTQLDCKPLPKKVSAIYEEADFHFLDNNTLARYAADLTGGVSDINPHEWIYGIILAFVKDDQQFKNKQCSRARDIVNLNDYVNRSGDSWQDQLPRKYQRDIELLKQKFSLLYRSRDGKKQLDRWIDAAYVASKLVEKEDFSIRQRTIEVQGEEINIQEAKVRINNHDSEKARFSNGVHQFLHMRLWVEQEVEGKHQGETTSGSQSGQFLIEREKAYLASKSVKNGVDYHVRPSQDRGTRGDFVAVTATPGNRQEIMELTDTFGARALKIPPRQKLQLKELPILVAWPRYIPFLISENAQEAHFRVIKERILQHLAQGRPAFVVCRGVVESEELHAYLESNLTPQQKESLNLCNGNQTREQEKQIKQAAGNNCAITITTRMWGRGLDIKAIAHPEGMAVIQTFVSFERDYYQVIGRTARHGKQGTAELILSVAEIEATGEKTVADAIKQIRQTINQGKKNQRDERQQVSDLKDQFYYEYLALLENAHQALDYSALNSLHQQWSDFLDDFDAHWVTLITALRNELQENQTFFELLPQKIGALSAITSKAWLQVRDNMQASIDQQQVDNKIEQIKANRGSENTSKKPLPPLSVPIAKPVVDNSDKPLTENSNHAAIYLDVLQQTPEQAPAYALEALTTELKTVAKQLNLGIPANLPNPQIISAIFKHHLTHKTPEKLLKTAFRQTITALKKYGTEADMQTAIAAYVTLTETKMKNQAPIDSLYCDIKQLCQIDTNSEAQLLAMLADNLNTWQAIYQFAVTELQNYSRQSGKASDRKVAIKDMTQKLSEINEKQDSSDKEKIQALFAAINNASIDALEGDKTIDAGRYSIFCRNSKGSRWQQCLDRIRRQTMASAALSNEAGKTGQPHQACHDYLVKSLAVLKERSKHSQFIALRSFGESKSFTFSDQSTYEELALITRCLYDTYRSELATRQAEKLSRAENAFWLLLQDIMKRSKQFNSITRSFDKQGNPTNSLRKALQKTWQSKQANSDNIERELERNIYKIYGEATLFASKPAKAADKPEKITTTLIIDDKQTTITLETPVATQVTDRQCSELLSVISAPAA